MEGAGLGLKVNPPIHRLGGVGRFVRAQLMAGILGGTPVLVMIQNLRHPLLNAAMKVRLTQIMAVRRTQFLCVFSRP